MDMDGAATRAEDMDGLAMDAGFDRADMGALMAIIVVVALAMVGLVLVTVAVALRVGML